MKNNLNKIDGNWGSGGLSPEIFGGHTQETSMANEERTYTMCISPELSRIRGKRTQIEIVASVLCAGNSRIEFLNE